MKILPEGIRTESNPINQNILSKLFSFVQLFVDIGRAFLFYEQGVYPLIGAEQEM